MGENSGIAWTHHTFNPWVGCTKISPGCTNCYAADYDRRVGGVPISQRNPANGNAPVLRWGVGAPRTRTSESYWRQPFKWDRRAAAAGVRHRVFCASLADVFDDSVDDIWRLELFDLIRRTPNLDWLLLTKRPENIRTLRTLAIDAFARAPNAAMATVDLLQAWVDGEPFENVWLGVTVENQAQAERRIPLLVKEPAVVRFLSCEPLLEQLDLHHWLDEDATGFVRLIDWVIVGGESGPNARPFHLRWAERLLNQCRDGGRAEAVPFMKQLGSRPRMGFYEWRQWADENGFDRDEPEPLGWDLRDGQPPPSTLVHFPIHERAGADPTEWPASLRIREFPTPIRGRR